MGKDRRTHDQKRKAKLAERAKKQRQNASLAYTGTKYQADRWVPHVQHTELAIYETIRLSERRLTNDQVEKALIHLIAQLRAGMHPLLPEGEPEVVFASGQEVEFLVRNIRRRWGILFEQWGPTPTDDLIGILRTLLNSIEAHAWHRGAESGYLAFLESFVQRTM